MAARSSAASGRLSATSPTSAAKSGVIGWTVMATASSWVPPDPVLGRDWTTERRCLQMPGGALAGETFMMRLLVRGAALRLGFSTARAPPTENEFSYSGA